MSIMHYAVCFSGGPLYRSIFSVKMPELPFADVALNLDEEGLPGLKSGQPEDMDPTADASRKASTTASRIGSAWSEPTKTPLF